VVPHAHDLAKIFRQGFVDGTSARKVSSKREKKKRDGLGIYQAEVDSLLVGEPEEGFVLGHGQASLFRSDGFNPFDLDGVDVGDSAAGTQAGARLGQPKGFIVGQCKGVMERFQNVCA
jgi:hypothetical protein